MRNPDPWPTVFMRMAHDIAGRSKDDSFQAGAVLVGAGNLVLAVGFNGPPPGVIDEMVPWDQRTGTFTKYTTVIHAEENAISFALDAHGCERVRGSYLFVTGHPCPGCVLRMIRAGVRRVVWDDTNPTQPRMVDESARDAVWQLLQITVPGSRPKLVPYSTVCEAHGERTEAR